MLVLTPAHIILYTKIKTSTVRVKNNFAKGLVTYSAASGSDKSLSMNWYIDESHIRSGGHKI